MSEMTVVVSNERIVKNVAVAIAENLEVSGDLTFRDNQLSSGELAVRNTDGSTWIPINMRIENGEMTISPGRMSTEMLGLVYEAMSAIEKEFPLDNA